ncbi:MAG: XdhC family protein [Actinomycetota bacterium]|nr:XdhC family protein [Actinomycetota bacterium]
MTAAISDRIDQLTRERIPFVRATVVRAQDPTSAHAGDRAIVLADGSVEGFVGGLCATGSVRTAALDVLASGEGMLLRVLPDGAADFPTAPGASVVVNPCLSGGALEIYLEPQLPPARLHLVGSSPVAEAVAVLAAAVGLAVDRASPGTDVGGATAQVVSSHDGLEADEVRAALDAGIGFVALVCSRTRGRALLAQLDLTDEELARVHPHAGVEIGARTAPEIALSVVAAVVRAIRVDGLVAPRAAVAARPSTAVDPVCGMTVTVAPDTPYAVTDGVTQWFCHPGCRDTFVTSHLS